MPQLKQPCTLEDLAFKTISSYITSVGRKLIASVCTKKQFSKLDEDENDEIEVDFSKLRNFLHDDLPRMLAVRMTSYILEGIARIMDKCDCTMDKFEVTGDKKCRSIVEQLILCSISPYLTSLDISKQPRFIRRVLCENQHMLVKLEAFTVRTWPEVHWRDTLKLFVRDLALLKNLTFFKMECECTDEILKVIGMSCKKLKNLDVNGSFKVSDTSIDAVLELKCLEQLHLSGTSITEKGFGQLLEGMGRSAQESCFNLRKYGCSFIRSEQLKTYVQILPYLTQLDLSTMQCDLSILKDLRHLQELKLSGGDFRTDNLKGLVEARGSFIRLLDLLLFQNVDLMLIGNCCNELKVLSLRNCSFVDNVPVLNKKLSGTPFQKLKELVFYVQCSPRYIHFLLVNSLNVRTVTIGLIREIDNDFVTFALSYNAMKQLEHFTVLFSDHLTLATVRLLMTHCPHLAAIGGLETWCGISEVELYNFREELKQRNLAISTSISFRR